MRRFGTLGLSSRIAVRMRTKTLSMATSTGAVSSYGTTAVGAGGVKRVVVDVVVVGGGGGGGIIDTRRFPFSEKMAL